MQVLNSETVVLGERMSGKRLGTEAAPQRPWGCSCLLVSDMNPVLISASSVSPLWSLGIFISATLLLSRTLVWDQPPFCRCDTTEDSSFRPQISLCEVWTKNWLVTRSRRHPCQISYNRGMGVMAKYNPSAAVGTGRTGPRTFLVQGCNVT